MSLDKNPNIKTSSKKVPVIKRNKKERLAYEARKKELEEYNKVLSEVKEKQKELIRQKKDMIVARNLLSLGISANVIAQKTNLSEEEIKNLK